MKAELILAVFDKVERYRQALEDFEYVQGIDYPEAYRTAQIRLGEAESALERAWKEALGKEIA